MLFHTISSLFFKLYEKKNVKNIESGLSRNNDLKSEFNAVTFNLVKRNK